MLAPTFLRPPAALAAAQCLPITDGPAQSLSGRGVEAPPPPAPSCAGPRRRVFTHHHRCLNPTPTPPHPTLADTMVLSQQISVSLSIIALCGLIGAGVAVGSGVGEPAGGPWVCH